jgi:hypothetical protein
MAEYQQKVSDSWSERRRLIRFRRKRENLHFWQELKIVPRWLVWTVVVLFLIAQGVALAVNLNPSLNEGVVFPPELQGQPVVQSFAMG